MSTMTKLVLGAMGKLRPRPVAGTAAPAINLPEPCISGGIGLMEVFSARRSQRDFSARPLPLSLLSELLWAANGTNRADGGRTAPSALNAQEIEVYVALPAGAYRYDPVAHALLLTAGADLRRITGYQDFVDDAPLDLIYVANHARLSMVPVAQREAFAHVGAGAVAQNVYLFAAGNALATVLRAWIDRGAIADALGLDHGQQVLLSQTVGYPKAADHVPAS